MATKNITKQKVTVSIVLALVVGLLAGAWIGYYQGTGEYPSFAQTKIASVLPPEVNTTEQTFANISNFIQNDILTNTRVYGNGSNCVDFALEVAREAHWEGLGAEIVGISFESGEIEHAVILFYTKDQGYQFYDPVTERIVDLKIGKMYGGRRISQLSLLKLNWIPLDEAYKEVGK